MFSRDRMQTHNILRQILVCLSVLFTLITVPNCLGQQPPQMKVEAGTCKGPSAPVGELHPGDEFTVCVHFLSDLEAATTVRVNFFYPDPPSGREGLPSQATSLTGETTTEAAERDVEIRITVPESIASGTFSLNGVVVINSKYGSYGYPLDNDERNVNVVIRNPDEYKYPPLKSVGVKK